MRREHVPQWEDKGTYKEPAGGDAIRVPQLQVDDATTYIDKDGSDNMTFTDAVTGTKTLAELAVKVSLSDVKADTDIADALSKKHSQNTDIRIQDADADTKIQVEEAADEDKIRFDTGGAERLVLDASGLDFKTLKAIAMVCDNGSTLPTVPAPVKGQWFLHTPTGRDILMQYNGTSWTPIISLGAITMYVDVTGATHGNDQNYGYSNAVTFDTIQFAVNQIPPLSAGDVKIYIDNAKAIDAA
jgi:hypothetical protein